MRLFRVMTLAVAVLAAGSLSQTPAQDRNKEAADKELAKLQGTWRLVAVESAGRKVPEEKVRRAKVKLVITGPKFALHVGGRTFKGTLTLDPGKSPRQLNVYGTTPEGKADNGVAIYEIRGDTLRVCVAPEGQARPTAFRTRPGSQAMLRTYRKQKPEPERRGR